MPVSLSQRLLAILQFTRIALVFTAISNAWAALLLATAERMSPGQSVWDVLNPSAVAWMTLCSTGLYGFGMSLNDVIDRRRDATVAADRPLPSGRLPIRTGKVICLLLLAMAIGGGVGFAATQREPRVMQTALLLMAGTTMLIVFYDVAGKYLISPGLITLGLIRFFHATIADPRVSMPWHPLLMLDHVAILSTFAYAWEQKRPALTRRHVAAVLGGLFVVNASLITLLAFRRGRRGGDGWSVASLLDNLAVTPALIWPALAVLVFVVFATISRLRNPDSRGAGKLLMLIGLLWLIVYDAAFVAGRIGWREALPLLTLGVVAWFSVKLIRAWASIVALSGKPKYIRAD